MIPIPGTAANKLNLPAPLIKSVTGLLSVALAANAPPAAAAATPTPILPISLAFDLSKPSSILAVSASFLDCSCNPFAIAAPCANLAPSGVDLILAKILSIKLIAWSPELLIAASLNGDCVELYSPGFGLIPT